MAKWLEHEVGHLRYILERKQSGSVWEMAQQARKKIKNRSVNAIAHKLRELISQKEFGGKEVELLGRVYPAEVISGYLVVTLDDGTKCPAHIFVWEDFYGCVPDGYHVHHINGNRLDNRLENLAVMWGPEHIQLHLAGKPPETFSLFCFLQDKGLWKEYLTYRNNIINKVMEGDKWKS